MPVTEDLLQNRVGKMDAGNIFPQIYITLTVCLGTTIFGAIFGFSSPANKHLGEMLVENYELEYAWTITIGPLAMAIGILPCAFFAKRLGPKKTILLQTPLNIIFWLVAALTSGTNIYHVCRFFQAFFSTTYYYCGEELLLETVHRKYQKVMYACCRTSFFIGILLMNSIGSLIRKDYFFYSGAVAVLFNCLILIWPPESPVHLMRFNPMKAKKSLKWYRGNREVAGELETIAHYVNFQKYETAGFIPMLKTKVVFKALKICAVLFMLKGLSGYYAFILYSTRWFTPKYCCTTPYLDSVIFATIVVLVRFISIIIHLYGMLGIRKPLLISTFCTAVLLVILGYYKFILITLVSADSNACITLPTMCVYTCAYECGINICPDLALYNYIPFQIYSFVKKIMQMLVWIVVAIVVRVYIVTISRFHSYITIWVLALNMFMGYIFVMLFVIESKGKPLMKIQIELGGNPVGTRGSRRQRVANPMDQANTDTELRDLIRHFSQSTLDEHEKTPEEHEKIPGVVEKTPADFSSA